MRCDLEPNADDCDGVAAFRVEYEFADGSVERFMLCSACARTAERDARRTDPDIISVAVLPIGRRT